MNIWDLVGQINILGGEGATKALNNVSNKFNSVAGLTGKVADGLNNYVTKPLLGLAKQSIETTMDFDLAMSKMQANARLPQKDFEKMRVLAQKMGQTTSKTASEAADALGYMALAGWDVTQMSEGLEPILRASEGGMMDLGLTSDLVTDSMSALGLQTSELGHYLDIAAKSQSSSNQSMQQFLEAMVTAGGSFKMFNTPLEESGALLGILANRGYKGSEAGNALISIMANLTTGSGKAGDAMKELNLDVYDAEGNFQGMSWILHELNGRFKGMTEAQRNTYIQMIGGKTRTKELNALLNGANEELVDLHKTLYGADGALNELAQTMQNNTRGAITRLSSAFEGIQIQIGDRLTPIIDKAAAVLQKLADWFLQLPDPVKDVAIALGAVAAAGGPILTVLTAIIAAVGGLIAIFTTVGLPVMIAVAALSAFALAIPAVITAVTALLYKIGVVNWVLELFQNIIKVISGYIKGDFQSSFDILVNYFGLSKKQATAMEDAFNELEGAILDIIQVGKDVAEVIKAIFAADKQKIIDLLIKKFGMSKKEAQDFAKKAIELKDKIIELGERIKSLAAKALYVAIQQLKIFAKWIYDNRAAIIKMIEKVVDIIAKIVSFGGKLIDAGKKTVEFASTANKAFSSVVKGIKDIVSWADKVIGKIGSLAKKASSISLPSPTFGLFAEGVRNFSGGYAMVGEKGPELIHLPKGSNVYTASETKTKLNGQQGSKTEVFNVQNISINAKDIKDITDLVNVFKNLKSEATARGY